MGVGSGAAAMGSGSGSTMGSGMEGGGAVGSVTAPPQPRMSAMNTPITMACQIPESRRRSIDSVEKRGDLLEAAIGDGPGFSVVRHYPNGGTEDRNPRVVGDVLPV